MKREERRRGQLKAKWAKESPYLYFKHPMDGLVNRADYEKGLEEAWDKVKPKGSTVTVEQKLKDHGQGSKENLAPQSTSLVGACLATPLGSFGAIFRM